MQVGKAMMALVVSASFLMHVGAFNPVSSSMNEYTDTKTWVVDPFIIPPGGNPMQEAIGQPGDFSSYDTIEADAGDRITFIQRPIVSDRNTIGDGSQVHGVYIVNDTNALENERCPVKSSSPCQPFSAGVNETFCAGYVYGLPLVQMGGDGGYIYYTTGELGTLAQTYGIDAGDDTRVMMFACPWRAHCQSGMRVKVVVRYATTPDNRGLRGAHSTLMYISSAAALLRLIW